jgi:hypothetical protein
MSPNYEVDYVKQDDDPIGFILISTQLGQIQ